MHYLYVHNYIINLRRIEYIWLSDVILDMDKNISPKNERIIECEKIL